MKTLIGWTIISAELFDTSLVLQISDEPQSYIYRTLLHSQECCEDVYINDFEGDIKDLQNATVIDSYESYEQRSTEEGTETFSFYHIQTNKGSVCLKFHGSSNGYYSERAELLYGKLS